MKMVESRCGALCSQCEYREHANCKGCIVIKKPIWGESCPVKSCCEDRGYQHCGQCSEFPCGLLNEFAYDKEHGDDGKRIETCCLWHMKEQAKVKGFDVDKFISDVVAQNADILRMHFDPNAAICWHDSNEQFTLDEYIRVNCEFPGKWSGEIQRVELIDDGVVTVAKISSNESVHLVTSFIKLTKGKINRLDEYFSDCGEPPAWRQGMNIGKHIGAKRSIH